MAIISRGSKLTIVLSLAAVLLLGIASVYAKDEIISYLPRNEDIQTVQKDYSGKSLGEVPCSGSRYSQDEINACWKCVDKKDKCPDCCLEITPVKRVMVCTPQQNQKYTCCPMPFDNTNCSLQDSGEIDWLGKVCLNDTSKATENHYQNTGCPSTEPNGTCVKDRDNDWLCLENNLDPKSTGCACRSEAKQTCSKSSVGRCTSPCNGLGSYYTVTPVNSQNCPGGQGPSGGPGSCYRYSPTAEFAECINKCVTYADEYDTCNNGLECCKRTTCSELNSLGYQNCDAQACADRIADPSCDTYTREQCSLMQQDMQDCITGGTGFKAGACGKCFQEVDSSFNYRFVARSRESITAIWQMATQPPTTTASNTYFFSKVTVSKVDPLSHKETQVYESMVHQKSLEAAFSIFCATQIPNDVLESGTSYVIRLYYFLPQISGLNLQVKVTSVRLIVVRTRY